MSTIINTRVISVPWPVSNWKPMETAPDDGRWIAVASSERKSINIVRWCYDEHDMSLEQEKGWYNAAGHLTSGWSGWLGLDEFNK